MVNKETIHNLLHKYSVSKRVICYRIYWYSATEDTSVLVATVTHMSASIVKTFCKVDSKKIVNHISYHKAQWLWQNIRKNYRRLISFYS